MPVQRIQLRRGTAAEWVDANPVLADGEPGVERDTGKQKVGDGVTAWAALPYTAEKGDTGLPGPPNTDASLLSTGTVPEGRLPNRLTPGELSATYVPKWKANTAYLVGETVLSPSGDVVSAKTGFTSGASYDAANWDLSATFATSSVQAKTDTLARLRSRLAGDERVRRMADKPPYDAPLMTAPPTTTETTALDATLTKSWSQTLTSVFRWDGPTASGSTPQYYYYADGSGRAASVPSTQVAFDTDADKFAVVLYGRTGMKYRLWVNEQATTAGFTTVTNNATTIYLNFDFGSYSTSPRRIVLEIELASFPIQFFGVRTKGPASVVAPSIRSPRAILVGDSFGTGAGALNFLEGYGRTLGRLLGIADFWSHFSSVAATGLIAAASATAGTFGSRLNADVIANAPDLIIIQGSQNDKPYVDTNQIGPALISYVNTLKAALPNCLVIVTGLLWVADPDANHLKINNELRTASTTLGVPFVDLITPVQFFTGTGTTSAPAGNGNADRYRNPDGSHPSQAGHYALAQILAGRIRDAISRA